MALETVFRQKTFHNLTDTQKQDKLRKDSEYEIAVQALKFIGLMYSSINPRVELPSEIVKKLFIFCCSTCSRNNKFDDIFDEYKFELELLSKSYVSDNISKKFGSDICTRLGVF